MTKYAYDLFLDPAPGRFGFHGEDGDYHTHCVDPAYPGSSADLHGSHRASSLTDAARQGDPGRARHHGVPAKSPEAPNPRGRYPSPVLRLRFALLTALVVILAACGGSVPASRATPAAVTPGQATVAPAATDEASAGAGATEEPTVTDEPAVTDEPTPTDEPAPSEEPTPTESPSGSAGIDPAAACSGSTANRVFFAGVAQAVEWPVLCGVLPKGWFVSQGSYRLANGGRLIIGYKGPGCAMITLSEGAWCAAADGCVPAGSDLGAASLGPLAGPMYQTADGFAILSAAGENPSWLMATKGLDQATTTSFAAALAQVAR